MKTVEGEVRGAGATHLAATAAAAVGTASMTQTRLSRRPDIYIQTILGYVGIGIPDLFAGEARKVFIAGRGQTQWN